MDTRADYQNYINAMQNFRVSDGRKSYQKPFADDFEKIFERAQDAQLDLHSAKDFLKNLTHEEMTTLQKYAGLADEINTQSLSAEGAYNLLMHDNEKYDFNADGVAEVGIAKTSLSVPTTMPPDVREAYIETMNSLSDHDRMTSMILTLDVGRLNSMINKGSYEAPSIDYNYLKERVENILHPDSQSFVSQETQESVKSFWQLFNASYEGDKSVSDEKDSAAVNKFLQELREKGAAGFLAELNIEKIEEKIEKFRQKLISEMGDSPEAIATIEKMVADFRKQLLEQLQASLDRDKKPASIDSQLKINTILSLKSEEKSPLVDLINSLH